MNTNPPSPPEATATREFGDLLIDKATALAEIATELGLPDLATTIGEDTRRRLQDQRVRAVVLGEIKQGKSTLINAILGADALPTGVTPTTGAVVAVRVGEPVGTFAVDGGTYKPLDAERFRALATGKDKPAEGTTLELVVGAGALPPSLELLDTPGMNDMERIRGAISRGELPRADVLLLVLDATQLLNRTELAFLRDAVSAVGGLAGSGARLLVAINRIDLVADSDRPMLVQYLQREIDTMAGKDGKRAVEIFQTNARGALKTPEDSSFGVEEIRRLRTRLMEVAASHAQVLPARARSSLLRHTALLAHNAAIAARAVTLKQNALRREIRVIERELADHESDMTDLRNLLTEGRSRLLMLSNKRIERFVEALHTSTVTCIESTNLRTLSSHLPGSIHDAFLTFTREESERLREGLDELTRQAIHTHGEQARRRLLHAAMRLGFRGPPIYIDPPSVALEAGLVAIGLAGTAVMYFGSLTAGLAMTIAGPLATVILRERTLRDARERAKAQLPDALEGARVELMLSITRVIEQHVAAVEEHLVLANVALGKQLVSVLDKARERLGEEDDDESGTRRQQAQIRLLELEQRLYVMRDELERLQPPTG